MQRNSIHIDCLTQKYKINNKNKTCLITDINLKIIIIIRDYTIPQKNCQTSDLQMLGSKYYIPKTGSLK